MRFDENPRIEARKSVITREPYVFAVFDSFPNRSELGTVFVFRKFVERKIDDFDTASVSSFRKRFTQRSERIYEGFGFRGRGRRVRPEIRAFRISGRRNSESVENWTHSGPKGIGVIPFRSEICGSDETARKVRRSIMADEHVRSRSIQRKFVVHDRSVFRIYGVF